jgi:4-carboxymuconolactone decarboxylase
MSDQIDSTSTAPAPLQHGERIRREVMGDDYLDRQLGSPDQFDRPLQELITEVAFGRVWDRPGLGRRDRSLLTVAMLTALGRGDELAIHVEAAVRNGLSAEELQEALLHAAIYCGIPAALNAFRVAGSVLSPGTP